MYTVYVCMCICRGFAVQLHRSFATPRRQHWKDVTDISSRHVMEELALLHPKACGIDVRFLKSKSGDSSVLKQLVAKKIDSHIHQVKEKGGDPLLELLHKIRASVSTSGGIHFITSSSLSTSAGSSSSSIAHDNSDVTPCLDQPQPPGREVHEEGRLDVRQVFGGPLAITSIRDPEQLRSVSLLIDMYAHVLMLSCTNKTST